ncbi:hypothetical protein [Virgisporangium aurantiacum]|nr:hypothetical protein [Virgisporangium aurantiacum]
MAGVVAAGAIGAALAVGGVAYAAGDPDSGTGEQIVRVVDQGGEQTRGDCPDKGENNNGNTETGTGENL